MIGQISEKVGRRPSWSVTPAGRWLVGVAIVLLTVNLRSAVTALSPLLPRVTDAVDLSGTQAGLLGALPPFCFAASALLGPTLLRRVPAEWIVVLSLTVASVGQLIRPWSGSAVGFLALSVLALFGMGLGNVVLPVLVKTYFPDRIGQLTAVYVIGLVAGTAVPPLLAVPMADGMGSWGGGSGGGDASGWQYSLAFWGALAAFALLPWILPTVSPSAVPSARPVAGPREPEPRSGHSVPIYRSPTAWGVLLLFGTNSLISYSLFAWLPVRLVDAGLPESAGGVAVASFAVIGAPGALIVPVLATRIRHQFPLVLFFASCFGVGLSGMLLLPEQGTVLWPVLAGVGGSGFPLALTLIGLRTRTPAMAGRLSGFAQGLGYLGAGAGPLAVGALYQSSGSWGPPFAFLGASLALFALGGWLIRGHRTVEDDLGLSTRGGVPAAPASPDTLGR